MMLGRGRAVRWLLVLAAVLGGALASSAAQAEQRFPPPDFTSHKLPTLEVPPATGGAGEYVDVVFLGVALCLASYFAIVRRSRRGLFGLSLVSLAWLGFWRQGCVCPIGSIQNVALALADTSYAIPLSIVAVFVLPIVFTLFFGRTFCAAVCPLGAVQELVALRPVRVPAWLEHALGLLAYIYLGAAVAFAVAGTGFLICRYDPFVAIFRLSGSINMLVFGGALLILGVFVGRPYCRYLCPLGAIFGVCSKAAKHHVQIPPERCIQCRLCEDACPYGAIVEPTIAQGGETRGQSRRRLAALLALAPPLVAVGALIGSRMEVVLGKLDPVVRLAERVRQEETGVVQGTTDASDAFRNTGRPRGELYAQAFDHLRRLRWAGVGLGAWVGLVVSAKLIYLAIRRRRTDFEPDKAGCVSCGRCFWYCPGEHVRLGLMSELPGPPAARASQEQVAV